MTAFSELGIRSKNLTGSKIEITDIIGQEITVTDYRIGKSKYNGRVLTLQFEYQNEQRITFTGSEILMEDIEKLIAEQFPFTTTIVKTPINERKFFLKFT